MAVFRNNKLVAEVGSRTAPLSNFRWPVVVSLRPTQFEPTDTIFVHLQRPNSMGWVYANYFGPQSDMQSFVTQQNFLRVRLPQWIQVIMMLTGELDTRLWTPWVVMVAVLCCVHLGWAVVARRPVWRSL